MCDRKIGLALALLLLCIIGSAQPLYFNRTYDQQNRSEGLFAILQNADGHYLTGGFAVRTDVSGDFTQFLKIDVNGDTILTKRYADSNFIYLGGSFLSLSNNRFLYANTGGEIGTQGTSIGLWMLGENLDTLWTKTIDYGVFSEGVLNLINTYGNDIVLCGYDQNDPLHFSDALAIKLDTYGNIIWQQHIGKTNWYEQFNAVTELNNGDLFFCGVHGFETSNNRNIYLVKTDSLGNFLWEKSYGGAQYDYGGDIIQTTDGNLLITGFYGENGSSKGYVLKVDTAGNQIWAKGYNSPGLDALYVSHELADGSLVFSGNWNSDNQEDGWLMKTDANGKVIWSYAYDFQGKGGNQTNFEYFWDMQPTADGGFVMCGTADNFNGNQDAWVVKVDSNGLCDTADCYPWIVGIDEPDAPADPDYLWAWPNPAHDLLQVRTTLPEHYRLQLLNTLGQAVLSRPLYQRQWLDVSALPAGVYLLELRDMKGKLLETDQILITDN